jgi:hypothetical protein
MEAGSKSSDSANVKTKSGTAIHPKRADAEFIFWMQCLLLLAVLR